MPIYQINGIAVHSNLPLPMPMLEGRGEPALFYEFERYHSPFAIESAPNSNYILL
ncbi:hypothetical protein CCP3SC15_680016 [Gammaproteobacteria bacterium]